MAKEKAKLPKLTTPPFRFSFPSLFEKTQYKDGKPSYNTIAIFEPGAYKGKEKERWDALMAEVDRQCLEKFGKNFADCKKPFNEDDPDEGGIKDFKAGLYSGMRKKDIDGFGQGKVFCTIKTYEPFEVLKYNGVGKPSTVISTEEDNTSEIYAGAYGRAKITVFVYANESSGVSFWISSVQKLKDGPRLDNRASDNWGEDDVDDSWVDQDEPPASDFD